MASHIFELPIFDIEEKHYQFKRLGLKAARHLIEIVKTAWKNGVLDMNLHIEQINLLKDAAEGESEPTVVTPELLLFFSAEHCLEQFIDLMEEYLLEVMEDKSLRPVSYEELTDEMKFPLYSLVSMAAFFVSHPDLSMFVSAIQEGKQLPFFQSLLNKKL